MPVHCNHSLSHTLQLYVLDIVVVSAHEDGIISPARWPNNFNKIQHEMLGTRKLSARWVLRLLTPDNNCNRETTSEFRAVFDAVEARLEGFSASFHESS